ncbi:MAG: sortase [Anaerolinea sp.]|nr:sortase [Anaerolinea sp.]
MAEKESPDEMSVEELQALLYRKKYAQRRQRLLRLQGEGRLVDVAGLPPPNPTPPPLARPQATPTGAMANYVLEVNGNDDTAVAPPSKPKRGVNWRWVRDKFLLVVEVTAVCGLIVVLIGLWSTRQELNEELAAVQRAESQRLALPTPSPTPIITVAVLPGGHKPPIEGRSPEPGEVGDIPSHLLPVINAYVPPPIPTPGPEQARRIQIPAIGVDSPIVQGDTWDQLKKGVGQHIGSAQPGQTGNLVLSAHNDIFGEIFRYLDKLSPGDEIVIATDIQEYTYVVRALDTVKPTDVHVMDPTDFPGATLISCYPYQVNTHRIVVFADLVTTP